MMAAYAPHGPALAIPCPQTVLLAPSGVGGLLFMGAPVFHFCTFFVWSGSRCGIYLIQMWSIEFVA